MQVATRRKPKPVRADLEREIEQLKIEIVRLKNTIEYKNETIDQMLDGLKLWNNLMTHEEYDAKWASDSQSSIPATTHPTVA
jgi:hypothetical protein